MVQTGHLFEPMPDIIRDDMAFIDRLHFYLPGWEVPKMQTAMFTDHYGFVVDYLAEALRELRKHNFTEVIDRHFSLGSHLNARDREAVRRTVSGLVKIIHPHGEPPEAPWGVVAGLSEGDAVDGSVELAVAGSAETVPVGVGEPHRQRSGTVVAGVCVPGVEPFDAGGLADGPWPAETHFRIDQRGRRPPRRNLGSINGAVARRDPI